MPKVSGVDFSALYKFRDNVSVVMTDGSTVELPLIPVKYATEGLTLLQRNDTLASRYAVVQTKLSLKAKALEDLKDSLGDDPDKLDSIVQEEQLDVFDATYKTMQDLQVQTAELCKESNKLCAEIIEFLKPHLDATIVEQLEKLDDVCTVKVLELMLYGDAAVNDEEATKDEENPTTPPSQ